MKRCSWEIANTLPTTNELEKTSAEVALGRFAWSSDATDTTQSTSLSAPKTTRAEVKAYLSGAGVILTQISDDEAKMIVDKFSHHKPQGDTMTHAETGDWLIEGNLNSLDYKGKLVDSGSQKGASKPEFLCKFEASIQGEIQIYRLSANSTLKSYPLNGTAKETSTETTPGACNEIGSRKAILTQKAIQNALTTVREELRNTLAPSGYVHSARRNGQFTIFRIETKHTAGLKNANKLIILQRKEGKNPLTNVTEITETPVAEAVATDQLGDGFVWIKVNDSKQALKVKVGYVVKPIYIDNFFTRTEHKIKKSLTQSFEESFGNKLDNKLDELDTIAGQQ